MLKLPNKTQCKPKCGKSMNQTLRPDVKRFYHNAKLALLSMFSTIIYIILGSLLFFYLEDCLGKDAKQDMIDKKHDDHQNQSQVCTNANGCSLNKHSFSKWLEFTIATVYTIGYGNTVPCTENGKIVVIFYSMIGVTLSLFQYSYVSSTILYLVKCTIKLFEFDILKRKSVNYLKVKTLVVTLVIFVLVISAAASISHHDDLQDFSWLNSFYFWWITISTIGYGDMRLQMTKYAEKHPEYIFLLFLFTVFGIAMIASTVSAIIAITKRETGRRFSKRYSNRESKRRSTKKKVSEYCSFCRERILGADDADAASLLNGDTQRSSFASSSYSMDYKPKTKVIENSNRADSQRSMAKLSSDMEYSSDDKETCNQEELQNVSPKMVTSTMATTRSSKL